MPSFGYNGAWKTIKRAYTLLTASTLDVSGMFSISSAS